MCLLCDYKVVQCSGGVIIMAHINIRIDDELKEESKEIFDKLGLDLSSGIKIYLNQVVREQGIPFSVRLETPLIIQAVNDMRTGNYESFESVDELFEDLENDY